MADDDKKETMLDAVNAALEDPKPAPVEKPDEEAETPEPETPEGEKPEGEKPEGEKPQGEKPDSEKPEGEKPQPTPEEKAAAEAAAVAKKLKEQAPRDPINDPIPPTVSERTKERITSLIGTVKSQAATIETQQTLFDSVAATGVTPENFAQTLSFLRAYNSNKAEDRQQAYKFLQSELRALALELGETPPGVDPLEGHQDLADAVAAQSMSQEHADELARARNTATMQQQRQSQTAAQAQAYNQAAQSAKADLNELGQTLAATDPQYKRKYDLLVPKLKAYAETASPSMWLAWFQREYRALKLAADPAPIADPAAQAVKPQQPLRAGKQPAGDGKKEPKTMLEAISASLEPK